MEMREMGGNFPKIGTTPPPPLPPLLLSIRLHRVASKGHIKRFEELKYCLCKFNFFLASFYCAFQEEIKPS